MDPPGKPCDVRYRVVPLGDGGVGKTSLLLRYVDDIFSDATEISIGVDFKLKKFEVEKKTIELEIWDTAGQERFRSISGSIYKGMDAIIVGFDLTDQESFCSILNWMTEIDRYTDSVLQLLVGNKTDLKDRRVISREEAEDMAERCAVEYIEVSAKTGEGVKELFETLPAKIEAAKKKFASKVAAREDYTTNVVSTARNRPEKECCNIF